MPPRPSRRGTPTNEKHGQRNPQPFFPPADTTTFKDLLLFEERLKMNAQMLSGRKRRYEAFLIILMGAISFLAHRTLLQPPDHPFLKYLTRGLFAVSLVTLVLFFASGMYEERIRYANRYVPHANRSLRSINMHLNMRRAPRSMSSYLPFTLRSSSPSPAIPTSKIPAPTKKSASSTPQVIPPIPPTSNPRGELIFSSRVERPFKDGYERYRSAFEKRREEKLREQKRSRGWFGWTKKSTSSPAISRSSSLVDGQRRSGTPPTSLGKATGTATMERSRSTSPALLNTRSEDDRHPFPPSQRMNGDSSPSGRSVSPLRESAGSEEERRSRSRAESYSFILNSLGSGTTSVEEDLRKRSETGVGEGKGQDLRRRDGLARIAEDVG